MADASKPALRMAKALRIRFEKEGSYVQLAKRITEEYRREHPRCERSAEYFVDRRKLKQIVEGEEVSFTMKELRALDCYLALYGEGLAHRPFFDQPDLLQSLAESRNVTFLLGSKLNENLKRLEFSHWDVRGMVELMRGINRYAMEIRFDIEEVRRGENEAEARKSYRVEPGEKRHQWARLLDEERGPSLVCLGSPRASHAAEIMLAKMYGVTPFERSPNPPPFSFVWTRMPFPSAFALRPDELDEREARKMRDWDYAIKLDGEFIVAPKPAQNRPSNTYGVVVAQRRPGGQVWMVIAGLDGAATFASARAVKDIPKSLQEGGKKPLRTPIEVTIQEDSVSGIYRVIEESVLTPRWD